MRRFPRRRMKHPYAHLPARPTVPRNQSVAGARPYFLVTVRDRERCHVTSGLRM